MFDFFFFGRQVLHSHCKYLSELCLCFHRGMCPSVKNNAIHGPFQRGIHINSVVRESCCHLSKKRGWLRAKALPGYLCHSMLHFAESFSLKLFFKHPLQKWYPLPFWNQNLKIMTLNTRLNVFWCLKVWWKNEAGENEYFTFLWPVCAQLSEMVYKIVTTGGTKAN